MTKKRFTDADYETMATLREQGKSCAEIGRILSCSGEVVNWNCLRLGADVPGAKPLPQTCPGPRVMQRGNHEVRRFTPEEDAKLLAMESSGACYNAIARALSRRHNSIRGRLMTLARHEARRSA